MAENLELGLAFFKAFAEKDLNKVAQYVDPNIHFLHPLMETKGKDTYLKHIEQVMKLFTTFTVREKFEAGNQAIIVHELHCPPPVGIIKAVALFTFKNKLITRFEVFFDPRSIEAIFKK